ncbi:MAG TPA: PH domain-containing protein [Methanomassiliicoccales archaeon]|nr:PH domain-containing protein [Methanomassiliicoccales archaeon]HPR97759.1 PH domain-containing protein [Methanomassiliicoccales archaeon]
MGKNKGGSLLSRAASGSPASDYLISGENIKWQGKPAAIIIMGKGLLLTAFALVYLVLMEFLYNSNEDLLVLVIAVAACLLMIITDRKRLGLIGGLAGIAIITWTALIDKQLPWYWYLIPLVFALLLLAINYIYLSRVLFVVTDQRIITRYGIFTLRYADTGIEKVQSVTTIQPWYERILGYGDVFFATAGEKGGIDYESPGIKLMSGGAVSWENVGKPFEVTKIASAVIHMDVTPVSIVNQPSKMSAAEKLDKIEDLRKRGIISQEEYEKERKEALEEL